MSQAMASNPIDAGESVFSPSDYFLGIAQRVIASGVNTRVTLPGGGEVMLYPARKEYAARIDDPGEFFRTPAGQFQSAPLGASTEPAQPREIGELLWQAGFHASEGRLVKGATKFDVVQFRQWPNLPRLPQTPNTARICALLTRHPTTIMLAHRQLGIARDEVYQVYSAAYSAGLASIINQNPEAVGETGPGAAEDKGESRGLFRSLFAKISGL